MFQVIVKHVSNFFSSKTEKLRNNIEQEREFGIKLEESSIPPEEYFLNLAKQELHPDIVYDNDALSFLIDSSREIKQTIYDLAELSAVNRKSYKNEKILVEKVDVENVLNMFKVCREHISLANIIPDEVKQVIVIRKKFVKDGNSFGLRRGKEIAQACHASMAFMTDRIINNRPFNQYEIKWLSGLFTKTVVTVDTEEQLDDLFIKAVEKGVAAYRITDAGKTEFDGIPTKTALAIGPDLVGKIDEITGHLKLY